MQLISKFDKGFRFLLCVIDIYSTYAWVIPLKDKKGIITTNVFQKILKESNRKPNIIWVDKDSTFYNRARSMNSWQTKQWKFPKQNRKSLISSLPCNNSCNTRDF